jgi:alcohol dehydrogenase (NADP+)
MITARSYAAQNAVAPLGPWHFERRDPGPHDVLIDILFCGVCHSDIHQARGEWGNSIYPMVPGHEIVGRVSGVGPEVKGFKAGDLAGVGTFIDSCRKCSSCLAGLEQYCEEGNSQTYNGYERDGKTPTYGGYSNRIVVDEKYTLHISQRLSLPGVAPLLCAGITTWSPLREWRLEKGQRLGVVGLGGLGHMAVKFGAAMGAEVTMLSTSPSKEKDARRLGAHQFALTTDPDVMKKYRSYFDLIIDCVSGQHDINALLALVKRDGTLVLVGAPPMPMPLAVFSIIPKRGRLAGSCTGGIRETQEMLDFCAQHDIVSDVEVIPIKDINEAYERTIKGDVRYRFVIDMASL